MESVTQMIQRDHQDQVDTDYVPTVWEYARIGAAVALVVLGMLLWDTRRR